MKSPEQMKALADEFFQQYPKQKLVYVTEDGQCFEGPNNAITHAREIKARWKVYGAAGVNVDAELEKQSRARFVALKASLKDHYGDDALPAEDEVKAAPERIVKKEAAPEPAAEVISEADPGDENKEAAAEVIAEAQPGDEASEAGAKPKKKSK